MVLLSGYLRINAKTDAGFTKNLWQVVHKLGRRIENNVVANRCDLVNLVVLISRGKHVVFLAHFVVTKLGLIESRSSGSAYILADERISRIA